MSSWTPYHYGYDNPITYNDPLGDLPVARKMEITESPFLGQTQYSVGGGGGALGFQRLSHNIAGDSWLQGQVDASTRDLAFVTGDYSASSNADILRDAKNGSTAAVAAYGKRNGSAPTNKQLNDLADRLWGGSVENGVMTWFPLEIALAGDIGSNLQAGLITPMNINLGGLIDPEHFDVSASNLKRWWGNEEDYEDSGANMGQIASSVGLSGSALSLSNSTFRVTNGSKGVFSPKLYGSGWKGGSLARINTYGISGVGSGIATGASVITTGIAINQIVNGTPRPITYVDAGVGVTGLTSSAIGYFAGVQIPYVGIGVTFYGAMRLSWDLGLHYGPSKWYGKDDSKWFK